MSFEIKPVLELTRQTGGKEGVETSMSLIEIILTYEQKSMTGEWSFFLIENNQVKYA